MKTARALVLSFFAFAVFSTAVHAEPPVFFTSRFVQFVERVQHHGVLIQSMGFGKQMCGGESAAFTSDHGSFAVEVCPTAAAANEFVSQRRLDKVKSTRYYGARGRFLVYGENQTIGELVVANIK